jgi:hypothetical protein
VRAVLDVNVLIAAIISPRGSPARLVEAWIEGRFELIVSTLLLAELERALAYPKLRRRVHAAEAETFVDWLRRSATLNPDPDVPPLVRSIDPGDDYLLTLAASADAMIVSGDDHLLRLAGSAPVRSPASLLDLLDSIG